MIDVADDVTSRAEAQQDDTELSASETPTEHAYAWALDDGDDADYVEQHGWRPVLLRAAAVFALFLAAAGVIVALWWTDNHHFASRARSAPTPTAASPTPQVAPTTVAPVDDDGFVAMALSPAALGNPHHAGFGTAGTQQGADDLAIVECRATTGESDCVLINSGMRHGCVAYAVDLSRSQWAAGRGPDVDAARAEAMRKLAREGSTSAECSDPPGLIRSEPTPVVTSAPPVVSNPTDDERFLAIIREHGITATAGSTGEIRVAHIACNEIGSGWTVDRVVAEVLQDNPGFAGTNGARDLVDAAIAVYCPR